MPLDEVVSAFAALESGPKDVGVPPIVDGEHWERTWKRAVGRRDGGRALSERNRGGERESGGDGGGAKAAAHGRGQSASREAAL